MARTKFKDKKAAEILERQYTSLDLRRRGLSYRKIADKTGVSHVQARTDVEAALKELATDNREQAEHVRELELMRLDAVYEALGDWVAVGNVPAINAYLKAMERRAKLLGLDAPDKLITLGLSDAQYKQLQTVLDKLGLTPGELFEQLIQQAAALDVSSETRE